MRKHIKSVFLFIAMLILTISTFSSDIFAAEENTNQNYQIYRVSYEIYDVQGNLKSTGYLPISEEEAALRINYMPQTLRNGERMRLTNNNSAFTVKAGASISMKFGLDHNATIWAGIQDTVRNSYLNQWSGFTGGLAINASPSIDTNVVGLIQNYSSDPITITWASFDFQ